jgi:hypothetical protein
LVAVEALVDAGLHFGGARFTAALLRLMHLWCRLRHDRIPFRRSSNKRYGRSGFRGSVEPRVSAVHHLLPCLMRRTGAMSPSRRVTRPVENRPAGAI